MIGIYKITNLLNNKVYIGQSKNIESRWRAHRSRPFNINSIDYEKPLYRAIRKYGLEHFDFQVLEQCSIEDLNNREQYWIIFFDSTNIIKGYNLTKGGETSAPIKLSEEQRDKIIDVLKFTDKTQKEIAKEFNVSQRLISGINIGEYWIKENICYPIRKNEQEQVKKNYCIICGTEIGCTSTYCIACLGLTHRKVERPEREELKTLIRTLSFVQIGKMYNVSDNAIRKWCKNYKLPSKRSEIKKYTDKQWEEI